MELAFEFSEEDFLLSCQKKIMSERLSIPDSLFEALCEFIRHPVGLTLSSFKSTFTSHYSAKELSLNEYIQNNGLEIRYAQFDMSSTLDTSLDVKSFKLPKFILVSPFYPYSDEPSTFKTKTFQLKTKNRVLVSLGAIHFSPKLLSKLRALLKMVKLELQPSRLGVWEWRQTFYNKVTGESYFCDCFKDAVTKAGRSRGNLASTHPHIQYALQNENYKKGICHLCKGTNSDLTFCHKMYGSAFKVRYGAYIRKFEISEGLDERDAENKVRGMKGVAKIGEKWVNETLLFNYIEVLFPKFNIQREASPPWLNRQRFDVYIPELCLAIEYQGEQHFKPIGLFGGDEGLKKAKSRDKDKLLKSKENGVNIVYFSYKDNLSEKLVFLRLKPYLLAEPEVNVL
ncbi:MAG: hypothetical protein LAT53_06445 [Idiomarina sp.]|nr:hypothetical protein [Idiomarina sp.]